MEDKERSTMSKTEPKEWEPPKLRLVGNVRDIVQGGGGKLSPTDNDSGDNRKPFGQA